MTECPDYLAPFVPTQPKLIKLLRQPFLAMLPDDNELKALLDKPYTERLEIAVGALGPDFVEAAHGLAALKLDEMQALRGQARTALFSDGFTTRVAETLRDVIDLPLGGTLAKPWGKLIATRSGFTPKVRAVLLDSFPVPPGHKPQAIALLHGEFNRLATVKNLSLSFCRLQLNRHGELRLFKVTPHYTPLGTTLPPAPLFKPSQPV